MSAVCSFTLRAIDPDPGKADSTVAELERLDLLRGPVRKYDFSAPYWPLGPWDPIPGH
jgi:hypothetical protein